MGLINNMISKDEPKYCVYDIYVGKLAKRTVGKDGKVGIAQIINIDLSIFRYASMDYFVDIETNEYYPLMHFGKCSNNELYYIPEGLLHSYTEQFHELLEQKGFKVNDNLTVKQLRQIVEELQNKHEIKY